jgi:hypothetical protein
MDDRAYSWNEVLLSARAFWQVRERGAVDSLSGVRMLDIARAYEVLTLEERVQLFLGVWLEREEVPAGVIAKMRRFLNGASQ